MKHWFSTFLVVISFFASVFAVAGEPSDLPYRDLVKYLPELQADGQKLAKLHSELCVEGVAPSADALLASEAGAIAESVRVEAKKISGRAGLLYFHDKDVTVEPALHEDAMRLDKELNGMDELIKMTRATLKGVSVDAPDTAEMACVSMGKLANKIATINVGLFVAPK